MCHGSKHNGVMLDKRHKHVTPIPWITIVFGTFGEIVTKDKIINFLIRCTYPQ